MEITHQERIAIIGAGTMGHGIGGEFARAGYQVALYRRTPDGAMQALTNIRRNLEDFVRWGLVKATDVSGIMGRLRATTDLADALSHADVVIEAVPENLELKREVFHRLDELAPAHAILASNTSSIMPSRLAEATRRPEKVIVAHFSYPPHLIPMVEIVRGQATSDETVAIVRRLIVSIGKSPIMVKREAPGFIINRMQAALQREALNIVHQGIASAQDVDLAVRTSFGRRLGVVGPIEMVEVQDGWDITQQIHSYILPYLDASPEPSPAILEKVERNELGPKTGRGFYEWAPEKVEAWNRRLNEALASFLKEEI